jgi:hypothetical protein
MTNKLFQYLWLAGFLGLLGLRHPALYGLFGLFGLFGLSPSITGPPSGRVRQ